MRYAFIRQHASECPVATACRVLSVSRSGYHAWLARPESARAQADRDLTAMIVEAHAASRRTYGAPRLHAELRDQGVRVGRKRVARLMRQAGLRGALHPRKRRRRGLAVVEPPEHGPDLVRRRFTAEAPGRVWCADVKQVWTREGWLYLAAVIDLHSRRIVGHACGSASTTALVTRALASAVGRQRPGRGLVHHSDRGAAYVSGPFLASLQAAGAVRSLSRPGSPLDNAVIESFFSTLERELLSGRPFATRAEARSALFDYIEVFYNRQRRHSTLDYLSPAAFEARTSTEGVSTEAG
ncbi:MAG TPA: IS3 family transposase [Rubricoccaceae bacterium]|nr:IS3 family transposase [Rubricoccaceae bacterium]